MFGRRRNSTMARQQRSARAAIVEELEIRTLLSAAVAGVMHSDYQIIPQASTTTVAGFAPSQLRHAYGFDQVTFAGPNGPIVGDGSGQTIAIVDAFNDPNVVSDLNVFDAQFGLPAPPSLKVVNQTGGSTLPPTDGGWAGEISLDVQWAHAIAPGANILLVEADNADIVPVDNLVAAAGWARSQPGVSVVSMSWGGFEFFAWNGTEYQGDPNNDPMFTTPSGHQGVTFVASAGDSGFDAGVQYPASSPNVLSVGGTTLTTLGNTGIYLHEDGWNGTNGGYSMIEPEPSYQLGVQSRGVRTVPDISYLADPATGVAIYDTVPGGFFLGWGVIGGTSLSAPITAAMLSIANQGRVLNHMGTLDGPTQTIPTLYSLYSAPGTPGYPVYQAYFHDVTDSGTTPFHWAFGGYSFTDNPATIGYDTATGLGTPIATPVIDKLAGIPFTPTLPPPVLPNSPIIGEFMSQIPTTAIGGTSVTTKLKLINTGATTFAGPLSVTIFASTNDLLSSLDTPIATIPVSRVVLKSGKSKIEKLRFNYPSTLPSGSYFLIAQITASGTATLPTRASTNRWVTVAAAAANVRTYFAESGVVTVTPGHNDSVSVVVQNAGDLAVTGTVGLKLYASADQTQDASDTLLATVPARKVKLKPGQHIILHAHFRAPAGKAPGTYFLIASTTPKIHPPDANLTDNTAVIGTSA